ncbi:MAG: hypothetical protein ACREXY_22185, partial [Gammaproteobacteria bacterium]
LLPSLVAGLTGGRVVVALGLLLNIGLLICLGSLGNLESPLTALYFLSVMLGTMWVFSQYRTRRALARMDQTDQIRREIAELRSLLERLVLISVNAAPSAEGDRTSTPPKLDQDTAGNGTSRVG